jgi:hypothetical protein
VDDYAGNGVRISAKKACSLVAYDFSVIKNQANEGEENIQ